MNIALIFAGGMGERLNIAMDLAPKQFLKVNGKPIIIHTLEIFEKHPEIDKIYIAIHPDYYETIKKLSQYYYISKLAGVVHGANTGLGSIYNALQLVQQENPADSIVLIHDGVRPNITFEVISNNIKEVKKNGNAITCIPCNETIVISNDGSTPSSVPDRKNAYFAQAPQSFYLSDIIKAHNIVRESNPLYKGFVDNCSLFESLGFKTHMIQGNRGNIKITTIEDIYIFRALMKFREDLDALGVFS